MNRPSYLLFKQCSKCGEILHVSRFHKSKSGKYGVRKICKECRKEISEKYRENNKECILINKKQYREKHKDEISEKNKQYYLEHKEEKKEYQKRYYQEHKNNINNYHKNIYIENKEEILTKQKQYYQEHKEECKERSKKYRDEHKEERKEYNKQYHKNNPHIKFNGHHKRNKLKENQGDGITKEQWFEMMEFFQWKCAYSDKYIGGDNKDRIRTIDHIVALDNGGEHEIWNCIPCYANYNYSKHTNNMLEWYLEQDYFDINRLTKIYEWRIYAYWKWNEKESV